MYCLQRIVFILIACCAVSACQKDNKTSGQAEDVSLASIASTTYHLGDTITIDINESLSQVKVTFDKEAGQLVLQDDNKVQISTTNQAIGPHQLIVSGISGQNKPVADTLYIELWPTTPPRTLTYSVLKTYPHQDSSFTQGLEFHDKTLYEGTGLNGKSKLMQIDLATGSILRSVSLPEQYFGEGITIVGNKIYQLTWTSGVCFRYSMDFKLEKTFTYHTQGWGLTHHDTTLIMSDGTNKLYFFTPDFQRLKEVAVYDNNGPVNKLNELEYVNGYVFANVWQTNRIVQIDPASGNVVGAMDMDPILPAGIDTKENVLNGIAFLAQDNSFYVTGKNWPKLYKISVSKTLL